MSSKNKKVFSEVGKKQSHYLKYRRELIRYSNDALGASKKAVFALHRGDKAGAKMSVKSAAESLVKAEKNFKTVPRLRYEGAYQAALEEYAEALLFNQFITKGEFGKLEARVMEPGTYLGALSDATGEVVRYAIREATDGNFKAVEHAKAATEEAIEFMLSLDLTGYLRQKFDQAKKNMRNLEQIMYEISMRK